MTYTIKAYAGTYRIKDELQARGFVWDSKDGGAWIKYHATEQQLYAYKTLQRGSWSGIVFIAIEEQTDIVPNLDYNPDKYIESENKTEG